MQRNLFEPVRIGNLTLPNRLVRSATAERMADEDGRPRPPLYACCRQLARGGVGLIISGHMYVHPSGKAHPEMTGIYDDELLPELAQMAEAVHQEDGRIVAQINHGGMQCSREVVSETLAPASFEAAFQKVPVRAMTADEIAMIIDSFAQAARRAREAGFDGVQIHAAHGYLIGQFLSPLVNRRQDAWGGDLAGRTRFLEAVTSAIRNQVGPDYPLLIKLGMQDGIDGGLAPAESLQVAARLEAMGIDALEISGGMGGGRNINSRPGIRSEQDEAYFRPLARQVRPVCDLPLILVGGLRSRAVMDDVLASGDADLISLCRPLICEPDLPNRLRDGQQQRSRCISANRCWPQEMELGIACKCELAEAE